MVPPRPAADLRSLWPNWSYPIAMVDRRQFLAIVGVSVGLTPVVGWLSQVQGLEAPVTAEGYFPFSRSDAEWRALLSTDQYYVLRQAGTERSFSSPLNSEKRQGIFSCAACALALFSSSSKYESGTGWPSFWAALEGAVGTKIDRGLFMVRTEVHCSRCGSHLGHLFPDGPRPTGQRYCMNGVALTFTADA